VGYPGGLEAALDRYEPVIGIEVHAQLRTASKMFCGCAASGDDTTPNTRTCPVCLGLPGALPVINRRAVEHVLATGMAIGATVPSATRWDRKNYFYPDLPKGYQISQYELPLASNGSLTFETGDGERTVRIRRAHLEEDTARLVHAALPDGRKVSLVDFDRSGMPLMEIVTEPDVRSAEEARRYAEELQRVLRYVGASDAEMERGQMRVEANVSLRLRGIEAFGTRVEVKNMNSFRSVERAIAFEIERQAAALDAGETMRQQTRGWDDDRGITYVMRDKEDSEDYRYFPEPDLPPLRTDAAWLDEIRARIPELPAGRRARYVADLGLSPYDAGILTAARETADYFEAAVAAAAAAGGGSGSGVAAPGVPGTAPAGGASPKAIANWVSGELARLVNAAAGTPKGRIDQAGIAPADLAALVALVEAGGVSGTNAKEALAVAFETGEVPVAVVEARGLARIADAGELDVEVGAALAANPDAVADYRAGKAQAAGFLVGQVMKRTRGRADAAAVRAVLVARLDAGLAEEDR
jgi:aspartyl-tRNA(Asn)/glutamyl-tRNA(Gln) amidotransferase subunit B